jgi:hypothetical protein
LDWIETDVQNGCALPATLSVKVGTVVVVVVEVEVVDVVGGPGIVVVAGVVAAGVVTGNVKGLVPMQVSIGGFPGVQARVLCVSCPE